MDKRGEMGKDTRKKPAVAGEHLPQILLQRPVLTAGTALWVINSWPSYFLMKVTTDTSA